MLQQLRVRNSRRHSSRQHDTCLSRAQRRRATNPMPRCSVRDGHAPRHQGAHDCPTSNLDLTIPNLQRVSARHDGASEAAAGSATAAPYLDHLCPHPFAPFPSKSFSYIPKAAVLPGAGSERRARMGPASRSGKQLPSRPSLRLFPSQRPFRHWGTNDHLPLRKKTPPAL